MRTWLDALGHFSVTLVGELVPGRECGACSICCIVLNVDTEEFQKHPGVPCGHMKPGGGCAIHARRFAVCHAYHCGWRYIAALGDEWRPDRSGVLVDFQTAGLPPHVKKRPGIRFTLIGDREIALGAPFLDHVARLIANDVPVILSVPGPPRHFAVSIFLNDGLGEAARQRDFPRLKEIVARLLDGLKGHRFDPVVHRHPAPVLALVDAHACTPECDESRA